MPVIVAAVRFQSGACLAVLIALLAPSIASAAKPGDLDRSFGGDGRVVTDFCTHERKFSVAIDHHGRPVVAGANGEHSYFCLARYKRNGRLDPTFGGDGRVTTDFGGGAAPFAVAIDSRGRIVAAGAFGPAPGKHVPLERFALARYKPNGDLDPSFGAGGKVTTDFPGGGFTKANAVAIDSRGRVVAAGVAGGDFALARYKRNGALDPSMAGRSVTTDFGVHDTANSVAIDRHGRIVAAGGTGNDFALARYEEAGTLDDSFSVDGKKTTAFGAYDVANSVAIDRHGRIVAAGSDGKKFALARYKPQGRLDLSFDSDGRVKTQLEPGAGAEGMAIDSRGRIVAVGGSFDLARYRPNGRLDRSFGRGGKKITTSRFRLSVARDAAIDSRDRIVVVGDHADLVLGRFIGYRGH